MCSPSYSLLSSVRRFHTTAFMAFTAFLYLEGYEESLLCAGAIKVDSFPLHLKKELQKLQDCEDLERQLQEIERNTCKVEIYVIGCFGTGSSVY